jgi:glycosyltransferase involved in cell wall biosynthesis
MADMATSSGLASSKATAEKSLPSQKVRVAVITSDVPFVEGGHRVIATSLAAELERHGFRVEVIRTPQNRFGRQFSAYLANWLTDVSESGDGVPIDQVISLRYPSYAVRHPRHVCWLNHRMREYYDLWPRFTAKLSRKGLVKERTRRWMMHRLDKYLLTRNVTRLFAQSKTVQERLMKWGKIPSEVLYPPPPPRAYRTESYDNVIFTVSRLHPLKRVSLLLQAMKHVKSQDVRVVVAGTGEDEEHLRRLTGELGISERVQFLGWVDDETLLSHYARCRAVFFAPFMEDFGFVTVEAGRSKKPVITCVDSGGPAELVANGRSGYVLLPDPHFIARQIDVLADNRDLATRLGEIAEESFRGINWESTLSRLLLP